MLQQQRKKPWFQHDQIIYLNEFNKFWLMMQVWNTKQRHIKYMSNIMLVGK